MTEPASEVRVFEALLDPLLLCLHCFAGEEERLLPLFVDAQRVDHVREVDDLHREHSHHSLNLSNLKFLNLWGRDGSHFIVEERLVVDEGWVAIIVGTVIVQNGMFSNSQSDVVLLELLACCPLESL